MNEYNREQFLIKTFPLEDGATYIQSLDKFNRVQKEDSLCPKCQSIIHDVDGLCWKCLIQSNK